MVGLRWHVCYKPKSTVTSSPARSSQFGGGKTPWNHVTPTRFQMAVLLKLTTRKSTSHWENNLPTRCNGKTGDFPTGRPRALKICRPTTLNVGLHHMIMKLMTFYSCRGSPSDSVYMQQHVWYQKYITTIMICISDGMYSSTYRSVCSLWKCVPLLHKLPWLPTDLSSFQEHDLQEQTIQRM